jgi:uncharacterized phage protein gp47/JayE
MSELLTDHEHEAMRLSGELFNLVAHSVIGMNEQARPNDVRELCLHIHGIQRMIMSQAAARAYPEEYRLLGEVLNVQAPRSSG